MQQKWTERQDRDLARLVRRFGTSDWALVRKHFKSSRTRDAVLKRWHCQLKPRYQKKGEVKLEEKKEPKNENKRQTREQKKESQQKQVKKAPPAIRKDVPQTPKTRITRAGGPQEKRKTPKYVMRKPLSSNRFQRLRSFLDNFGPKSRARAPLQLKRLPQRQERSSEAIKQELPEKSSKNWSSSDDEKLRSLVVNEAITDWRQLSEIMKCSKQEAQKRWKKQIYKKIKLDDTVGGFLKYSNEEDSILVSARKNGLSWDEIMIFLPGRSAYSIESRHRRASRSEMDIEMTKNRHFMMRQFLKKIVHKKRMEKEPFEETKDILS